MARLCSNPPEWKRMLLFAAVVWFANQFHAAEAADKNPNSSFKTAVDIRLRKLLDDQGIDLPNPAPPQDAAKVKLGQALFFDAELSGNRDISCATCHHPALGTADGVALPVGTGADVPGTLGLARQRGIGREFNPRNALELFNRGDTRWQSQFWDGRLAVSPSGYSSSAGDALPGSLPSLLSAQAMFPVTSREEMRGQIGDSDVNGRTNELALVPDDDFAGVWSALMDRLLQIPEYQTLFAAAFPDIPMDELGFGQAATAIAAFEKDAYTFTDSPWDDYVAGDNGALSAAQKRGALLFYGTAKCSGCHAGTLMTDQEHHNIGAPQLGPGKGDEAPLDHGRGRETGDPEDNFKFRTPPLRNCEISGPYLHSGAYNNLEDTVRHHAYPTWSLLTYDPEEQLGQAEIRQTYNLFNQLEVAETIDFAELPGYLTQREIRDLVSFLKALTSPDIQERLNETIPDSVPSGLPLDE